MTNKKKRVLHPFRGWGLLFLIAGLLITACKKNITINFPAEHTNKVFIEGMLYPGQKPQIFISKSNSFFSSKVTPQQVFARDAVVKITSGSTVDVLVPDSTYNKFRCRWEPFYRGNIAAEFGKTYIIKVSYEGKIYTATTTINQKAVTIQSITYTPEFFDVYGGHDGVIIKIKDPPGTRDYYRFQMNSMIDSSVKHAHVLDEFVNTCAGADELFPVTDIGRIVFTDENADGQEIIMTIEVTYEYSKDDSGWILYNRWIKIRQSFTKILMISYKPFKIPL